jgi:hypothetical protein
MKSEPIDPAAATPLDGYDPVQTERQRHDGWTQERQIVFLVTLAETGCVTHAARETGITARSAYRLRAHPDGKPFAAAWNHALRLATGNLLSAAYERAIAGTPTQHWRDGKLVGESRAPSDRLLIYLLNTLKPFRHGPHSRWGLLEITANEARGLFDESLHPLVDNNMPVELLPDDEAEDATILPLAAPKEAAA